MPPSTSAATESDAVPASNAFKSETLAPGVAGPSTSAVSMASLPDEVIVSIFKQFKSASDVYRARSVSKRFWRVATRSAYMLARPKVKQIRVHLEHDRIPRRAIGRLRPHCSYNFSSPRRISVSLQIKKNDVPVEYDHVETEAGSRFSPDLVRSLNTAVRQFVFEGALVFEGITVTDEILSQFLLPFVDVSSVQRVSFTLCKLQMSPAMLGALLAKTQCSSLSIEICEGADRVCVDDVFTTLISLESLVIRPRPGQVFAGLTDELLRHWKTAQGPQHVDFATCITGFSSSGLLAHLQSLQKRAGCKPIVSDFGAVRVTPTQVKTFVSHAFRMFNTSAQPQPQTGTVHIVTNLEPSLIHDPELNILHDLFRAKRLQPRHSVECALLLSHPEAAASG